MYVCVAMVIVANVVVVAIIVVTYPEIHVNTRILLAY